MHPLNQQRVNWAHAAIDQFSVLTMCGPFHQLDPEDQQDCIADLITDLMHLAVDIGADPQTLIDRGVSNFDHENAPNYEGD